MKFLAAFLILISSYTTQAQDKDYSKLDIPNIDVEKIRRQRDSSMREMDSLLKESARMLEHKSFQQSMEQNERNLNAFMAEQTERRKKSERSLWISGGMLVFGVGISIAGYLRNRKKSRSVNS